MEKQKDVCGRCGKPLIYQFEYYQCICSNCKADLYVDRHVYCEILDVIDTQTAGSLLSGAVFNVFVAAIHGSGMIRLTFKKECEPWLVASIFRMLAEGLFALDYESQATLMYFNSRRCWPDPLDRSVVISLVRHNPYPVGEITEVLEPSILMLEVL